ncbi:RHS repeat-associated core domain-containing protein [Chitinophaga sp. 30R24]|uniref:RHS repeat-associated core domain-containing protein n=1 Tax=Chitinophaga sp. 30R24 TaxID=3248838 RepID=UPI003B920240
MVYRYGFNGKENDNEVKGEGNQQDYGMRVYDPRIGRFFSVDPLANKYPTQSTYSFAANNPIMLVDVNGMGPGDPLKHTVAKGESLADVSKKYGVSVEDISKMNNIKDGNLVVGQVLNVNPEANFSQNPRGGYQNPNNAVGVETPYNDIANVGLNYVAGTGAENTIITGGTALASVQNWAEVRSKLSYLVDLVMLDGKAVPGEAYVASFRPGSLLKNVKKGVGEAWGKIKQFEDPWRDNSQNSPIHVLGSFSISIRVNANGTTATICVYDSKTTSSFSDNKAGGNVNRGRQGSHFLPLTSTYQRYLWNIDFAPPQVPLQEAVESSWDGILRF